MSSTFSRMIASVVAFYAEIEAENTSIRTKMAYDHNVRAGKYRGGFWPLGYHAVTR